MKQTTLDGKHLVNGMPPRKTYRFSSSACEGGYLYIHKTADGEQIADKDGLRRALVLTGEQLGLIDVTVKIYNSLFFFFFMMKNNVKPITVIECIQEEINKFGKWHDGEFFGTAYDLQEAYIRRDLEKLGFDYDKG